MHLIGNQFVWSPLVSIGSPHHVTTSPYHPEEVQGVLALLMPISEVSTSILLLFHLSFPHLCHSQWSHHHHQTPQGLLRQALILSPQNLPIRRRQRLPGHLQLVAHVARHRAQLGDQLLRSAFDDGQVATLVLDKCGVFQGLYSPNRWSEIKALGPMGFLVSYCGHDLGTSKTFHNQLKRNKIKRIFMKFCTGLSSHRARRLFSGHLKLSS